MIAAKDFERYEALLAYLGALPGKMISIHEANNLSAIVLHDICNMPCFGVHKAAYFVDNPEFNTCAGIVGFCKDERCDWCNAWQDPVIFDRAMQTSAFNQQVRALLLESIVRNKLIHADVVKRVAPQLGFAHPVWHAWHLKHGNDGLLVYEKDDHNDTSFDQHFINTLALLGFCAIH